MRKYFKIAIFDFVILSLLLSPFVSDYSSVNAKTTELSKGVFVQIGMLKQLNQKESYIVIDNNIYYVKNFVMFDIYKIKINDKVKAFYKKENNKNILFDIKKMERKKFY